LGSAPASNPGVTFDANIVEPHCNIEYTTNHDLVQSNIVFRDRLEIFSNYTNHTNRERKENPKSIYNCKRYPNMWTLLFDGSKYLEGPGVCCILQEPDCKKIMTSCKLEFQCTNNTVEYESLLQVLRKEIDLKETRIKVFCDSKIFIR
jgi:hypothetical protein